jgi:anti-sigma B factor antagonist
MSVTLPEPMQSDYFQIQPAGDIAVMIPAAAVENIPSNLIEPAAQIVLATIKADPPTYLIIDLSQVNFFGSEFISFLLRCHLVVKKHNSELVLAGVSPRIRELLRQTALDTLWAIYDSREQALKELRSSD